MKRRTFMTTAVGAAGSVLVSATSCSDSGGAGEANQVEVFSWWTGGGEEVALEALKDDFEKRNEDITFENAAVAGGSGTNAQSVLQSRLQANKPPDSFQGHAGAELLDYIQAGQLEPLDSFYEKNKLSEAFNEQLVDQITHEGHVYSVPLNIHRSNVLWFNPKILDQAGIDEPPTSIEEFIDQLGRVQSDTDKIALSLGAQWTANHLLESVLLGSLGGPGYNELWTAQGDWSTAEVTSALQAFGQILDHTNQEAENSDWQVAARNVVDGKAAFNIMGDWAHGYFLDPLKAKENEDFGWVASPGTDGVYLWLADSFTLPEGAPHRPAALKWLRQVASKRGQDIFNPKKGSIPARVDADRSLYQGYLAWALEEWANNDLAGSFWHGVVANNKWKSAIDTAVGVFLQDTDAEKLQGSLVDAAEQHAA